MITTGNDIVRTFAKGPAPDAPEKPLNKPTLVPIQARDWRQARFDSCRTLPEGSIVTVLSESSLNFRLSRKNHKFAASTDPTNL